MRVTFLTLFPNLIQPYLADSIMQRAQDAGAVEFRCVDIRDFTTDKHHTADDRPFGGGAGMVMKAEPILTALRAVQNQELRIKNQGVGSKVNGPASPAGKQKSMVILLDARGTRFTQAKAQELSQCDNLIFICGRYEGVDERVNFFVDERISIGDYVVTGGELPALVVADAVTRLLPGVLGNPDSLVEESFVNQESRIKNQGLEYPQYTRPEVLVVDGKEYRVPEVLLSGDHAAIARWREEQRLVGAVD